MQTSEAQVESARRIDLAGMQIELYEAGEGPPLVFLHGGSGPRFGSPFLRALSRDFRVIAPAHPGFGASDLPDWVDSVDDFAHLYIELIDRLRLDRPYLVGASLGGWIAAELATKRARDIARLALIAPLGIKVGPRDRLDIPDVFAMPEAELNRRVYHDPVRARVPLEGRSDAELAVHFRNQSTLALVTWEPYMHNPKLRHRLHMIAAPTLIIRGASDGIVSEEYASAYARLIPGARLCTLDEAGHAPQSEQPAMTAETIRRFWRQERA